MGNMVRPYRRKGHWSCKLATESVSREMSQQGVVAAGVQRLVGCLEGPRPACWEHRAAAGCTQMEPFSAWASGLHMFPLGRDELHNVQLCFLFLNRKLLCFALLHGR
jgi:hypothetical protein